jgi:LysM repeat protein
MATINLSNYYNEVERGMLALEEAYARIEAEASKLEDSDFDAVDWGGILWSIQDAINNSQILNAVHKFERLSKEQMQALFAAQAAGESTGKIVVVVVHTIRQTDTLRSIELEYGVPWQDILDYNGMTANEFNTLEEIKIPIHVDVTSRASKEILVFGDQTGLNILGRDLPNELVEDSSGDLKVLEPVDAFAQAMDNLAKARRGDLPYYENWGLDLRLDEDWPAEAFDSALQLRVAQGFSADPRVKNVSVLEITRDGTAVKIRVEIEPLQGPSLIVGARV